MVNQMRGQLQVANDIGVRANGDVTISPLPSSGMQQAFDAAAGQFAQIGQRIGLMADKAAAREGHEEGLVAGMDPEFRTMRTHTIRGDAFDKAGLDVAETRLRQDVEARFDAAYAKHAADPEQLHNALGGMEAGVLKNTPEELRPQIGALMRGKRLAYSREQARQAAKEAAAAAEAAQAQQLDDLMKGMHQRAYALGVDADADAVLANDAAVLSKTLERRGTDGKLMIAPEKAVQLQSRIAETVTEARLKGAFGRLPSLEAKQAFLQEFEADYAGSKGLAKVFGPERFETVKNGLEADLRSAQVQHNAETRAVARDVKSVADMAAKGYAPSPAEMSGLKARVAATSDPGTAEAMAVAEDTLAWQAAARRWRLDQLEQYIEDGERSLRARGATPNEVARLDMARKLADEARKELKRDQLGWTAKTGLLDVVPLDLSSADNIAATMKARVAQAETAAEYWRLAPQYIRPDDKKALAAKLAEGGQQGLAMAAAIAQGAGDKAAHVMSELADYAPVMSALGTLTVASPGGVPPVAADAFDALAARRERVSAGGKALPPVPMPQTMEKQQALASVAGVALGTDPRNAAALLNATDLAYEIRAARNQATVFDAGLYEDTMREVLGQREINGVSYGGTVDQGGSWWRRGAKLIIPPAVRSDAWPDVLDLLTPNVLEQSGHAQPVSASGMPISVDRLKTGTFVPAGAGRYFVALGDANVPGEEGYVQDGRSGEALVLDFDKLMPVLRKRRPDLFLGGN